MNNNKPTHLSKNTFKNFYQPNSEDRVKGVFLQFIGTDETQTQSNMSISVIFSDGDVQKVIKTYRDTTDQYRANPYP